jgi:hypothetical protein
MKTAVAVALACLAPGLACAASLTGSIVDSKASVDLPAVGTLDWARWPGYLHKRSAISDITTTGWRKDYADDVRVIGNRTGVKIGRTNATFTLNVAATTAERTLRYYIGGWNATGRVTVTLPGAAPYTTTFSSRTTFSRVVTVKFRADAPATLNVTYQLTAGTGSINVQAAALSEASASALLTWQPPVMNSDGSPLSDLAAFKVYWGTTEGNYTHSTRISNAAARAYTVTGLASGTWYFVVTALNSAGLESLRSNVWSKTVP